ncbi:MAG TPA: ABC transporter permease [Afifellaceae bacterium]|nr:ABC transporter permease [Afifellaceae bacterium]
MTDVAAPLPRARKWSRTRVVGNGLIALWTLAGIGIAYFIYAQYDPEFYARYAPRFFNGFIITVEIVVLSIVIGALISLPITLGRLSQNPLAGIPAYAFVYFFRGTPLIAQTFLVYYGAGQFRAAFETVGLWWFFRDSFNCVVFTFALNTAAYQAEILRGAIRNVTKGQREAAQTLGMPRWLIFWKIILPQALIVALRPYGNEIVLMIKGSAIASIVTVFDLMGETRRAFSRTFDFQTYIWAAIIYLVMVEILRRVWDVLEARLTRHLKRETSDDDAGPGKDPARTQRAPGEPPAGGGLMPH